MTQRAPLTFTRQGRALLIMGAAISASIRTPASRLAMLRWELPTSGDRSAQSFRLETLIAAFEVVRAQNLSFQSCVLSALGLGAAHLRLWAQCVLAPQVGRFQMFSLTT